MTSSLFASSIRPKLNGRKYRPAGGVFAIEGTVYPGAPAPPTPLIDDGSGFWAGFASGAIGGLTNVADGLWYSECIGYPAVTTPMWPSAQIGQHNLSASVDRFAKAYKAQFGDYPPITIIAWSQGAIAADLWWTEDVLPENGSMHYLKDYVYRIYNYGDPLRAEGISLGNDLAGLPAPGKMYGKPTAGIGGPQNLTPAQTLIKAPDGVNVVLSFNNPGDLYGAAPSYSTSAGKVEYSFFKMIMKPGFVDIVGGILGDFLHPIGDIEAGFNAAKFFAAGPGSPHFQYTDAMLWVINDLVKLGNSLPHQRGI